MLKKGQIEYKADKTGIVHSGIGKLSFSEDKLKENITYFIDTIIKAKPKRSKRKLFKRYLSISFDGSFNKNILQIKINLTLFYNDLI